MNAMQVVKTESFNTNNAWGFGGSSGTDTYHDNDIVIRRARNSHRHTGTSSDDRIGITHTDKEGREVLCWVIGPQGGGYIKPARAKTFGSITLYADETERYIFARVGNAAEVNYYGTLCKKVKTIYL